MMPRRYTFSIAVLILLTIAMVIGAVVYNPDECTGTSAVVQILEKNGRETIVLLEGNVFAHVHHSVNVGDEICVDWSKTTE